MKAKKSLFTVVVAFALALVMTIGIVACNGKPGDGSSSGSSTGGGSSGDGELKVSELIIGTKPDRTNYYAGDVFDPTGMKIRAKWSDGITLSVELSDCEITPSGPLTVSDKEVTISYGGKSVKQAITVVDTAVKEIAVNAKNIALKIPVNTPIDLSGIEVSVTYEDGNTRIVEDGYTFKVDGKVVDDVSSLVFPEWGKHTVTIVYGEKTADLTINVFDGFMIEAENMIDAGDVTEETKNYVEITKASASGRPRATMKENEPASGGGYMGAVFNGSVIRFHVYVEENCNAEAILRASSAYMITDGGSWSPVEMGDMQFNRLFKVSYGSIDEAGRDALKVLEIADDVILKGGSTENENGDPMLYVNWMDVNFGTVSLKKGDNVIELNVITDYINVRNENVACNIDRLEIRYTEEQVKTAVSLSVKNEPEKTEYVAGEAFDVKGLVVEATMSDGSKKIINNSDLKITPSGALMSSDTEVTIGWSGLTVKQAISVKAASKLTIEGENIVADPTADDKNYVEVVRRGYQGTPKAQNTEAPGVAETSGGKYLSGMFGSNGSGGATVRFHIYSEKACSAKIKIFVSSCNVKTRGSDGSSDWNPSEMADVQFNTVYEVRFGLTDSLSDVTVADDVTVKGGKTPDGKMSMALWENWVEVDLGTFSLREGDNILEIENINSTMTNLAGEIFGLNIDRLVVEFNG